MIESLNPLTDSFKTAESFSNKANYCFYEWLSELAIRPHLFKNTDSFRYEIKTVLLLVTLLNYQEHFCIFFPHISKPDWRAEHVYQKIPIIII